MARTNHFILWLVILNLGSARWFLLRVSDLQFLWLQSYGGCSWRHLKLFSAFTSAGAFHHNTLHVARPPPSWCLGFKSEAGCGGYQFLKACRWTRVWHLNLHSSRAAVSAPNQRGDVEGHLCMGGVSMNLEAIKKNPHQKHCVFLV